MFRGHLRAIVVACGLALACANHADAKNVEKQGDAQNSIASSLDHIASAYDQQAELAQNPNKQAEPCHPGDDRRYSEMCAQWKAADAASDSAWWAWAAGLSAIISTVAVLVAIGLTYQANQIARDTAKRQLRAYVFLNRLICREELDGEGKPGLYSFIAEWKNFGQTPAQNVKVFANCWHWHGSKLPPWFTFPDLHSHWGLEDGQPNMIAPGERIEITPNGGQFPPELKHEVRNGWRRVFCWGWITYDDQFGQSHKVTYCRRIRVIGITIEGAPDRLEPVFYDEHNCEDQECDNEVNKRPPLPLEIANRIAREEVTLRKVAESTGDLGISADTVVWDEWLREQVPPTFERHGDGSLKDETPRDYFGVTLDTYDTQQKRDSRP